MSYSPNADHLEHWIPRIRKDENDLYKAQNQIERMQEVGDKLYSAIYCGCLMDGPCKACSDAADMWDDIKEAKP